MLLLLSVDGCLGAKFSYSFAERLVRLLHLNPITALLMSLKPEDISKDDPEQLFRVLDVIGQGYGA